MNDFNYLNERVNTLTGNYNTQQYTGVQQNQIQYNQAYLEQVEQNKIKVCDMLRDLKNEDFKRIACNCMVDELMKILTLPLNAQDRIYFQNELDILRNPQYATTKEDSNFRSAKDLVEEGNNYTKNNQPKGENHRKNS